MCVCEVGATGGVLTEQPSLFTCSLFLWELKEMDQCCTDKRDTGSVLPDV